MISLTKNKIKLNCLQLCRLLSSKQTFLDLKKNQKNVFPDINSLELKRGTGGRSSFNGQIITVFGGTGFVGKYLINKLSKMGSQIIIPFRGDINECQRLKLCGDLGQILFAKFNLKDSESIYNAMKYSNIVINLIGKDNETNNYSFEDIHIKGAQTIAKIAKEVGIKRLVHLSSMNVCENPEKHIIESKWLKSKYFGELSLRQEFPESIIIRASDIHGTDDHFCQSFCWPHRRQFGKIALFNGGFGTFKRPVYVGDVAQAIVNSLTDLDSPGQTYQAVGPRLYEMRALIEYINRIIQKTPEHYFYVVNLKWHPFLLLKVWLLSNPKWLRKYPFTCIEKLERECISDVLDPSLPTIEDLGIKLTQIEDKWEYNLMHWKRMAYYGEEVGEFPELEKPQFVN